MLQYAWVSSGHMIDISKLQKVIEHNTVVDIKTLQVRPGEIVALVGPAGSGKNALLELLIGQSRPTMGEVRLAGLDPQSQRDTFSRQVGVLFAQDSLYQRQSAESNLVFHCRLHGLPNIDYSGEDFDGTICTLHKGNPLDLPGELLQWRFRDIFFEEILIFRKFTKRLTGTAYSEFDTFIPLALLANYEAVDWTDM